MKLEASLAVLLALALGCGGGASKSTPKQEPPMDAKPDVKPAGPEPEHILVAHVLISFQGAGTKATRSKADAEKMAGDVLARAKKGEDFNKLIRDLSDDEGDGVYGLSNHRVNPVGNEYERRKMVAAFGDVGFKLDVSAVGMSTFDPQKSPYGWHIIKRLK